MENYIKVRGARQHNLKNISLDIPKNKLVVLQACQVVEKAHSLLTLYMQKAKEDM